MTTDQLKEFLDEMIAFLTTLDKVIPNKVDEELIQFLQLVESSPWLQAMIIKILPTKK